MAKYDASFLDLKTRSRTREVSIQRVDDDGEVVDTDFKDPEHKLEAAVRVQYFLAQLDADWEIIGHSNTKVNALIFKVRRPDGIQAMKEAVKK